MTKSEAVSIHKKFWHMEKENMGEFFAEFKIEQVREAYKTLTAPYLRTLRMLREWKRIAEDNHENFNKEK
ncbi:MAG: hypothetical protein LBC77_03885 [Spirochaetaceae bacterium]|jgi:hypothetical protein|nr:hypothetical protein [Spirochaetaceae bacterium]